MRKRREKKGFTLVELICVVALLAILAVLAVPAYNKVQDGARKQIANSNARTVYSIGKANDALAAAGIEGTEAMPEGSYSYDATGAEWKGDVNGKEETGVFKTK